MTSDDSLASGVGSERANSRSISFKNESTDASVEVPKLKLLIAFLYTHYNHDEYFYIAESRITGKHKEWVMIDHD